MAETDRDDLITILEEEAFEEALLGEGETESGEEVMVFNPEEAGAESDEEIMTFTEEEVEAASNEEVMTFTPEEIDLSQEEGVGVTWREEETPNDVMVFTEEETQ